MEQLSADLSVNTGETISPVANSYVTAPKFVQYSLIYWKILC